MKGEIMIVKWSAETEVLSIDGYSEVATMLSNGDYITINDKDYEYSHSEYNMDKGIHTVVLIDI